MRKSTPQENTQPKLWKTITASGNCSKPCLIPHVYQTTQGISSKRTFIKSQNVNHIFHQYVLWFQKVYNVHKDNYLAISFIIQRRIDISEAIIAANSLARRTTTNNINVRLLDIISR